MKKISFMFLLLLLIQRVHAQPSLDFGFNTIQNCKSPSNSFLLKWGFMSDGIMLGAHDTTAYYLFYDEKLVINYPGKRDKIRVQLGGDIFFGQLGSKTFESVPLLPPQTGTAKVTLNNQGALFNVVTRFSAPNYSLHFIPYLELFSGFNYLNSYMEVTPDDKNCNCGTTTQDVTSAGGLDYGASVGVLIPIIGETSINIKGSYMKTAVAEDMPDINSSYADANGIGMDMKDPLDGMFSFTVGLSLNIDSFVSGGGNGTHHSSGGGFFGRGGGSGSSGCGHVGTHSGGGGGHGGGVGGHGGGK